MLEGLLKLPCNIARNKVKNVKAQKIIHNLHESRSKKQTKKDKSRDEKSHCIRAFIGHVTFGLLKVADRKVIPVRE